MVVYLMETIVNQEVLGSREWWNCHFLQNLPALFLWALISSSHAPFLILIA